MYGEDQDSLIVAGMASKMTPAQIQTSLAGVPGWHLQGDLIEREFTFRDFVESMAFVGRVADAAELTQHHPDILIRYSRVKLGFSTHDAGGLTEKDFSAARAADLLANS